MQITEAQKTKLVSILGAMKDNEELDFSMSNHDFREILFSYLENGGCTETSQAEGLEISMPRKEMNLLSDLPMGVYQELASKLEEYGPPCDPGECDECDKDEKEAAQAAEIAALKAKNAGMMKIMGEANDRRQVLASENRQLSARVEMMESVACHACRIEWGDDSPEEEMTKFRLETIEKIQTSLLADLPLVDIVLEGWAEDFIERKKDDGEEPSRDEILKEVVDAWGDNANEHYYGDEDSLQGIADDVENLVKDRKVSHSILIAAAAHLLRHADRETQVKFLEPFLPQDRLQDEVMNEVINTYVECQQESMKHGEITPSDIMEDINTLKKEQK